jgi:hypothetical protein
VRPGGVRGEGLGPPATLGEVPVLAAAAALHTVGRGPGLWLVARLAVVLPPVFARGGGAMGLADALPVVARPAAVF